MATARNRFVVFGENSRVVESVGFLEYQMARPDDPCQIKHQGIFKDPRRVRGAEKAFALDGVDKVGKILIRRDWKLTEGRIKDNAPRETLDISLCPCCFPAPRLAQDENDFTLHLRLRLFKIHFFGLFLFHRYPNFFPTRKAHGFDDHDQVKRYFLKYRRRHSARMMTIFR